MSASSTTATPTRHPSFFEVRWGIFLTAERLLRRNDSDELRRIQSNILDCELRRIERATEKHPASF